MSPIPKTLYPKGVHFVGSVPCDTTRETLTLLSKNLPDHIRRLPDGEPSNRQNFIFFQIALFRPYPELLNARVNKDTTTSGAALSDQKLREVRNYLSKLETGYDTAAIDSYHTFVTMRNEGVIPQGVRFQVSIPTPLNALSAAIAGPHRNLVEPYYEAAMKRALKNIQTQIPHEDLAIQIDCAHEFGLLEEIWRKPEEERFAPWWVGDLDDKQGIFDGVIERIVRFADQEQIAANVELGFHFCYGDIGHKHFVEPKDMGLMVKVAKALLPRLQAEGRKVSWIHMPVPKERDDEAYFEPLRSLVPILREGQTECYPGLIRESDEAGTRRRVETARNVLGDQVAWGAASECGYGRTPRSQMGSILEIMKSVAASVR
ncbi:hypothetical protein H2200_006169 [Cladophialophora chaetospira]|uniref:Uncharacterized protein n=1 Tax=Cladophialophora chaetospira TaxID=386627 RepID=A0AA39CJ11_9EURO|nr:hypothetical protein H2200_006169 [Cladophialophora chaetospira]